MPITQWLDFVSSRSSSPLPHPIESMVFSREEICDASHLRRRGYPQEKVKKALLFHPFTANRLKNSAEWDTFLLMNFLAIETDTY